MSAGESSDSERRYSEICGATNRNGEPCGLPAGWGTPGSGGTRCKFHGGASTGPTDTTHLEDNDFAEGNPGGGAPELNTNAQTHGAFADWKKAYERFDGETRAYVKRQIANMRERAKENAPEVSEERRERLLKENATLSVLWQRAVGDTFDRGIVIGEDESERVAPTWTRGIAISIRQRKIAEELRLRPAYQEE